MRAFVNFLIKELALDIVPYGNFAVMEDPSGKIFPP